MIDATVESFVFEITGNSAKINQFIELMRPLGLVEISRTGVAAISRGKDSEPLAKKLGAHIFIDSSATNAVSELQKLGGAQVILATAPSGKAMSELVPALAPRGKFLVIGASGDPLQVQTGLMIGGSKTIQGWASGIATDSEDTLRFAELSGVRPMIEKFPLAKVNEAYARMTSGKAQFRVVLTM